MIRMLVTMLAVLAISGCERISQRVAPEPRPSGPPPIQMVAAVDEGGGRYLQVTLSRMELPFDVKSATLNLPGRPPVQASEIRRNVTLGDTSVGRPPIGVDVSGGSRSGVNTGASVAMPIARQGAIQQMIVILPIADPQA